MTVRGDGGKWRNVSLNFVKGPTDTVRMMTSYLTVRSTDVVHETLEAETIVIDLQSGAYYSLTGFASMLFLRAMSGATKPELLEWAQASYPSESQVAEETSEFLDTLVTSGLCVVTDDAPETFDDTAGQGTPPADYHAPLLQGYEDMAELLLLDPIHEVEPGTGWPNKVADA